MGNLNVTTDVRDDTVKLADALYVSGSVTLNTGGGDDLADWRVAGATVLGAMTIRTGDGADAINLDPFTVGGPLSIDLGSLDDSLSIDDSLFFWAVSINAGSGNDQIRIEQTAAGAVGMTFKGVVAIRLASGDDQLMIGRKADLANRGIFSQRITIDGGPGLDLAAVLPTTDGGTRHHEFAIFPTFLGSEATT